jgi:cell division protein FtsB
MQPIENSADELIQKIELLSSEFKRLSAQLEHVKSENKELKKEVNSYKTEIKRLRDKQSSNPLSDNDSDTIDTAAIQRELEMYIAELDECIEKMKQL